MWFAWMNSFTQIFLFVCAALVAVVSAQDDALIVASASELQSAIRDGARHIVITEHMDVRLLETTSGVNLVVTQGTRIIEGRCTGQPSEALRLGIFPDLTLLEEGQCVIITDETLFEFQEQGASIWLHNLYLRTHNTGSDSVQMRFNGVAVWMTSMILQGGGTGEVSAFQTTRAAQLYVQDSDISFFNRTEGAIATIEKNSSAAFDNCNIRDNYSASVNGSALHIGLLDTRARRPSAILVTGGSRANNPPYFFSLQVASYGQVYSDRDSDQAFVVADGSVVAPGSAAAAGQGSAAVLLLADDNPHALEPPEVEPPAEAPEDAEPSDEEEEPFVPTPVAPFVGPEEEGGDGGSSTLAMVGGAIGGAVVLLLAALTVFWCVWRRRKARKQDGALLPEGKILESVGPGYPGYPGYPRYPESGMGSIGGSSMGRGPMEIRTGTITDTFTGNTTLTRAPSKANTPLEELENALDHMYGHGATFYHRYKLLSSFERRVGGQGLVQFANVVNTQDQAVIKFYTHRGAFTSEKELYMDAQLKEMMPATLAIEENQEGVWRTPYGYVFPPFVIIERGQSLDEWARDNKPDFITTFQALSHSVRSLRKLHSIGYAHRDIKPGNILRRPKQHDWTLIDFGCTAQIGSTAGLAFSLRYSPPEVVQALEAGCKTVHVDAAVDIWAIGVIAYELLTGKPTFQVALSAGQKAADEEVRARIAGRKALPWEEGEEGWQAAHKQMRGLKRTVLRCLDRNPAKRPSAEQLLNSWEHMFDSMQTHGTDWSYTSGGSGNGSTPAGQAPAPTSTPAGQAPPA